MVTCLQKSLIEWWQSEAFVLN